MRPYFQNVSSVFRMFPQKLLRFSIASIFIPIYQKILGITPAMYIYFELPKIKLSLDKKNQDYSTSKQKVALFSSSFFFIFLRKIICSLIFFQRYHICRNCQSNFVMVNKNKKNKKRDTEFWSDFYFEYKTFCILCYQDQLAISPHCFVVTLL